jgi:hypothetical protein
MKLVAFDLDMTLFDHSNYTIPESALKAVELIKKGGNKVAIASGRNMHNKHGQPFLDIIKPDAVVEFNGSRAVVLDKVIYNHLFDRDLLNRLIDFVVENNYAVGMTSGDKDYYFNKEFIQKEDMLRWGQSDRNFQDPELLKQLDINTLCYIGPKEGAFNIEKSFPELKLPLFSGEWGADIIEKEVSKFNGVSEVAKYFGIDNKDIITFGDAMNDYEMIKNAGVGVAMGNAHEKLKEVADIVTDDIGNDGVFNACKKLGLI